MNTLFMNAAVLADIAVLPERTMGFVLADNPLAVIALIAGVLLLVGAAVVITVKLLKNKKK